MELALAGAIAAALAFIELQSRLRSLQPRALAVWSLRAGRLGLEAAAAIGAAIVARGAVPSEEAAGLPGWLVVGLAGGVGGPAFLRLTLITFGKDAQATPIGLSSVYEPIRNFFERQLDEIGADAQTAWMQQKVLPTLKQNGIVPSVVARQLGTYVQSLSRLADAEKLDNLTWIKNTANDSLTTDDQKIETLLFRALALGARRSIERLLNAQAPPTSAPPAPAPQPPSG